MSLKYIIWFYFIKIGSATQLLETNNYSNSNTLLLNSQYSNVSVHLKITASILYILSMVLGIGGNTFVLLVFMYYQRVKTVTNFFIINLAISDLIFALLCIPSTYISAYLTQYWPFSYFGCVFLNYMQNVSVTLTIYTLILITLDKYWALVKPLKLRISLTGCKYLILISWTFSLFISLPITFVTKLVYYNNITDLEFAQCQEEWPIEYKNLEQPYNLGLLLIQYFIPLIILSYCYAKIGLKLKKTKAPGETDLNREAKMCKSRKKILKMCFTMVLTFMLFWAPIQFLNFYRFYDNSITSVKYFSEIFFICHIIAVSRSFINPFIYAWLNPKFLKGVKYFLFCYWCLREKYLAQITSNDLKCNDSLKINTKYYLINKNSNRNVCMINSFNKNLNNRKLENVKPDTINDSKTVEFAKNNY